MDCTFAHVPSHSRRSENGSCGGACSMPGSIACCLTRDGGAFACSGRRQEARVPLCQRPAIYLMICSLGTRESGTKRWRDEKSCAGVLVAFEPTHRAVLCCSHPESSLLPFGISYDIPTRSALKPLSALSSRVRCLHHTYRASDAKTRIHIPLISMLSDT
jgi:hypothetical protein